MFLGRTRVKRIKNCQSCGMPLNRDEGGGGTEADGSRSKKYCSHCYQKGKFTEPNLTADQMITKVKSQMREMRIPGVLASLMTRSIPRLERWKRS